MIFLNPIWLWGLGGLLIPIGIHLLSRKEGKTIRIGSIRFLTETSTSRFSSIRLNEVALLTVRSLLIGLITLFLAGLLLSSVNRDSSVRWVVVEKGLENNSQIKNLLDSLKENKFEVRRLADGFPLPDNDRNTIQVPDYYKLSEELAQKKNTQSIVIASNNIAGFKGKRISLPENVRWLTYPVQTTTDLSPNVNAEQDTLHITLVYSKTFQYDKKIMLAALNVIQSGAPAEIIISEIEADNFKAGKIDWLIWLSDSRTAQAEKILQFSPQPAPDLIVQETKYNWALTKRLTEENALKQHLTIELMNMLFSGQIKKELSIHDKRTLPDELTWSKSVNADSFTIAEASYSADKILIVLITLIFIAERTLAFYRKQ